MKCTDCKFWTRSKTYGNSCTCRGEKPCERKHKDVARKKKREQINKKRSLRYGYGKDKIIGE